MLCRLRLAAGEGRVVGREGDLAEVVGVSGRIDVRADLDCAEELFGDLASEGGRLTLALLDLPAGELPQPWQRHSFATLRTEHGAVAHDDRAHDVDLLAHADSSPWNDSRGQKAEYRGRYAIRQEKTQPLPEGRELGCVSQVHHKNPYGGSPTMRSGQPADLSRQLMGDVVVSGESVPPMPADTFVTVSHQHVREWTR